MITHVNVAGAARLPAFCHASIAGDQVFVSGSIATKPGLLELIDGEVGAQTVQTLRNIETILDACGCTLADIAKVNVYLTDMSRFTEMNDAYLSVFGDDPPARITVGCTELALGAAVEIDCIAFRPTNG